VVIPAVEARGMVERARALYPSPGNPDEEDGRVLLVWGEEDEERGSIPVLGNIQIRWGEPDADHVTVWRLQWNPEVGGSESLMREAMASFRRGSREGP
jgi:hypothetical protein